MITLDKVKAYLEDRLAVAQEVAAKSSSLVPDSYSSGYDQGELAALSEILALVNGELE